MPAQLFLSYRRTQSRRVQPIVDALRKAGADVFFDTDDIEPLADFPGRIRLAIDASPAMIVWWSTDYAKSQICLQELLLGWQHARRQSSDVSRRIWIVNPENDGNHIFAGDLAKTNYLEAPSSGYEARWAETVLQRLKPLLAEGLLADERTSVPHGLGWGLVKVAPQFTGRGADLWRIQTLLHPARLGIDSGASVQLHGLGGIGKTQLAAKYAAEFSLSYPGGVFWLNLASYEGIPPSLNSAEVAWFDALRSTLAGHPWLAPNDKKLSLYNSMGRPRSNQDLRAEISNLLGSVPSLWILDNVPVLRPDDLRDQILDIWKAPAGEHRTLITTRDARVIAGFSEMAISELQMPEAVALLSRFRKPEQDELAAALVDAVGAHTLALSLLGHRLSRGGSYRELLNSIRNLGAVERIEKLSAWATDQLKLGKSARGILATLQSSIDPLNLTSKAVLLLIASCAPHEPIAKSLLHDAFSSFGTHYPRKRPQEKKLLQIVAMCKKLATHTTGKTR